MEKFHCAALAELVSLLGNVVFLAHSLVGFGFFLLFDYLNNGLVGTLVQAAWKTLTSSGAVVLDNCHLLGDFVSTSTSQTGTGRLPRDLEDNLVPLVANTEAIVLLKVLLDEHLMLKDAIEHDDNCLVVKEHPWLGRR